MATYKTKQKDAFELIIKSVGSASFTAEDLLKIIDEKGLSICRSTVYRRIQELEAEGKLKKFSSDSGSVLFQYREKPERCDLHMHLYCSGCGKILHVDCDFVEQFTSHMREYHGFTVNRGDTMIFGLCEQCKRKEENK